mmetsp:Transcript_46930/g.101936  ORF Transcript_46930/g.101936 Transcript_46930/m.101936 type:complete len:202 (+) Transcript_46930:613-1218(+)
MAETTPVSSKAKSRPQSLTALQKVGEPRMAPSGNSQSDGSSMMSETSHSMCVYDQKELLAALGLKKSRLTSAFVDSCSIGSCICITTSLVASTLMKSSSGCVLGKKGTWHAACGGELPLHPASSAPTSCGAATGSDSPVPSKPSPSPSSAPAASETPGLWSRTSRCCIASLSAPTSRCRLSLITSVACSKSDSLTKRKSRS